MRVEWLAAGTSGLASVAAGAVADQEPVDEAVQGGPVHMPGHEGDDRGVARGGLGLLAQRLQHRGQRRRTAWGQVPLGPARATERDAQPEKAIIEPIIGTIASVGAAALVH